MWPSAGLNVKRFLFTLLARFACTATDKQARNTDEEQCEVSWLWHVNAARTAA